MFIRSKVTVPGNGGFPYEEYNIRVQILLFSFLPISVLLLTCLSSFPSHCVRKTRLLVHQQCGQEAFRSSQFTGGTPRQGVGSFRSEIKVGIFFNPHHEKCHLFLIRVAVESTRFFVSFKDAISSYSSTASMVHGKYEYKALVELY
jgi:hypothetical protein